MPTDNSKTLDALQTAIRMEIDGKEFYLKAGEASTNEIGSKLFKTLAKEEDGHRALFEKIYKSLQSKNNWPDVTPAPADNELKTLFAKAVLKVKPSSSEIEAVHKAMEMENKTRDFYQANAKEAQFDVEKEYYVKLAGIEAVHHKTLLDYYEYLKNPVDYFTLKEHHSLDGG